MKTIIAGSRYLHNFELLEKAIKDSGFEITEVVCGCAQGVDTLGNKWADQNHIPVRHYPADWEKHGKPAGAIRNRKMAEYAEALICLHANTPGSLNMVMQAEAQGLKVFEVVVNTPTTKEDNAD